MKHFQPDDRHTVTPRIITPKPDEMVRFVKEVFRAPGEFHVDRPSEIQIGDSLIMISNGMAFGNPRRPFFTSTWKMSMRLIGEQSKREQKHLSFLPINCMATGERW